MSKNKNKGFTLIEVLVVIAIIGILTSIVFVNVNKIREKAKVAAALQSFHQIQLAMYMYWQGDWPECRWWTYCQLSCKEEVPPFVPEFYSSWDASYYCNNCIYKLSIGDMNSDGRVGWATIYIFDPEGRICIYKNILCEDDEADCNNCGYTFDGWQTFYDCSGKRLW